MKKLHELKLTEVEKQRLVNFYDYLMGDEMEKDLIFYKLYEIVRWDYEEGADMKYPIPFEGKDVGAFVRSLLLQAESHLTPHAHDSAEARALRLVLDERKRQDEKWGANRNLDDMTWLTILVEEVGEAAECILKEDVYIGNEITQIAAVALAWLECKGSYGKMSPSV